MKQPLPFALAQLDRLMTFFPRVDAKATYLFTLNLALLGLTAVNFPYRDPASAGGVVGALAVMLTLISCISLYRAFIPTLKGSVIRQSVLFFGAIADHTTADYTARLRGMTEDELLDDAACQIHRNAEILSQKFGHVQIASLISTFSAATFVIFVALVAASGASVQWKV